MRWEYLRVTWRDRQSDCIEMDWRQLGETLNDYGSKGWELVAIVETGAARNEHRLTFKRAMPQDEDAFDGPPRAVVVVERGMAGVRATELVNTVELRERIADAVTSGVADGMKKGGGE